MAKIIKKYSSEPLESGAHHAVVRAVIDLGLQAAHPAAEDQRAKWQYGVCLELPSQPDSDGKPRTTWLTVNGTLNEKSTLSKLIAAAGVAVGDEFDPAALVDANLTVLLDRVQKSGKTYANVSGFTTLAKATPRVRAVRQEVELPQWLEKKRAARLDDEQVPAKEAMAEVVEAEPNPPAMW